MANLPRIPQTGEKEGRVPQLSSWFMAQSNDEVLRALKNSLQFRGHGR